jgi:dTDP-glucose 4,6-dehydratase
MKIVVTGGLGFIGSNFLTKYVPIYKDVDFVCIDIQNGSGKIENLNDEVLKANNFKLIYCDISEGVDLEHLLHALSPDIVIHLAAESSVDLSFKEPSIFHKTNVIGTENIVKSLIKLPSTHLIYMSTDEIYGEMPLNSNSSFKENDELKPNNPYSRSKVEADRYVRRAIENKSIHGTILRSCNAFGFRQGTDKLIPATLYHLLYENKAVVYGDGKNTRERIYVNDLIEIIRRVAFKASFDGLCFNIGTGNLLSNKEVIDKLIALTDKNKSEITIESVEGRKINDLKYHLDSSLFASLFAFKFSDFEVSLQETVEEYISNSDKSLLFDHERLKKLSRISNFYYGKKQK